MVVRAAVVRVLQGGSYSVRWPSSRDDDHRTESPFGGRQFHCGCISFSIVHQFSALIEYLLQTQLVHIISTAALFPFRASHICTCTGAVYRSPPAAFCMFPSFPDCRHPKTRHLCFVLSAL